MRKKLIGITPRIMYENNVQKEFVNSRYLEMFQSFDFNTVLLTLNNPCLNDILDLCDGFVITGGFDINPNVYDEENKGSINIIDELDDFDSIIIDYCVKSKKPLLGICRGLQSINVFLGGNLYQDLGDSHLSNKQHIITINKCKFFDKSINVITNSYHHQAIKDIAHNLIAFAISNDGIIEGIYHRNLPIIAVQWHPEVSRTSLDDRIINIYKKMF